MNQTMYSCVGTNLFGTLTPCPYCFILQERIVEHLYICTSFSENEYPRYAILNPTIQAKEDEINSKPLNVTKCNDMDCLKCNYSKKKYVDIVKNY